ncbi:hypothetical protein GCM10010507_00810 [Streptomyces cinnamoneus]|uniref:Uncharacterized protein n=1 Tax=Streptomyces cinnamoneus TaxID=53446 RepID=A0A918TBG3_STRCJ|nr:hypothetical protein GCM10010507_00810 [Streptomyces cinnamoneus]
MPGFWCERFLQFPAPPGRRDGPERTAPAATGGAAGGRPAHGPARRPRKTGLALPHPSTYSFLEPLSNKRTGNSSGHDRH